MNNSYKTCGSSSFSLQALPSDGGESMRSSRSLVFTMRKSRLGHSYKAYLDDTKTFLAKPQGSIGFPSYTLYDRSKANVLAYAKRYSKGLNNSPKWEVRREASKANPLRTSLYNKGREWWVGMGENTTDDLRIDKHSLRRTTIIKDGVMVAPFARKKWWKSAHEFCLCVSNEEQLWVLLLLYAVVNVVIDDSRS